MKRLLGGSGRVDLDVALPLVYAGLVLTLFEYRLLPTRLLPEIRARSPELPYAEAVLHSGIAWALACVLLFLVVPLILSLVLHRVRPRAIGWNGKGFSKHVFVYLLLYLFMLPFILWASEDPEFTRTYPFVPSARTNLEHFLLFEGAYLLQFLALESFFRGYLLFSLARKIGANAVFVAAVPYTMIHFHKPEAECFGALIAGIVLGFLALRFRSFLGGAVLHALVAATMDVLSVRQAGLF